MSKSDLQTVALGALLRHWRDLRGKSQLDVALEADVSQRHISFIESGRAVPGRQKLLGIAEALDVPFRERNTLLLAAGYAPIYSDSAWDAPEMHCITAGFNRMLRQHEPFPAVVMDRYWTVVMANDAAPRFFNAFIDLEARQRPRNLLHLMFDPTGMRPFIADWADTARSLLARVHRESVGRTVDSKTRDLLAALLAYPDVEPAWTSPNASAAMPVIPIGFVKDGVVLRYFSMVATVGTPQTIAAQELRLECMVPADDATERQHLELMKTTAAIQST